MIRIAIPSYRKVEENNDSYTAFNVEVYMSGRTHNVEKRYSEFEDIHKQLKKSMQTPEFPPKKVLRWNSKVLEQRRQGLQSYLQGIILQEQTVPKSILRFLNISLARTESEESDLLYVFKSVLLLNSAIKRRTRSLDQFQQEQSQTHQPMIGFPKDAFLQDNYRSSLPDIVAEGVLRGLYNNSMDDISIR